MITLFRISYLALFSLSLGTLIACAPEDSGREADGELVGVIHGSTTKSDNPYGVSYWEVRQKSLAETLSGFGWEENSKLKAIATPLDDSTIRADITFDEGAGYLLFKVDSSTQKVILAHISASLQNSDRFQELLTQLHQDQTAQYGKNDTATEGICIVGTLAAGAGVLNAWHPGGWVMLIGGGLTYLGCKTLVRGGRNYMPS